VDSVSFVCRRQRRGARGANLDGDLVGRAADAAGADLKGRTDVLEGTLEHGDGLLLSALANGLECAVDDALGDGLLAVEENAVDQLGHDLGAVNRVIDEGATGSGALTRHYFFSFFAP